MLVPGVTAVLAYLGGYGLTKDFVTSAAVAGIAGVPTMGGIGKTILKIVLVLCGARHCHRAVRTVQDLTAYSRYGGGTLPRAGTPCGEGSGVRGSPGLPDACKWLRARCLRHSRTSTSVLNR